MPVEVCRHPLTFLSAPSNLTHGGSCFGRMGRRSCSNLREKDAQTVTLCYPIGMCTDAILWLGQRGGGGGRDKVGGGEKRLLREHGRRTQERSVGGDIFFGVWKKVGGRETKPGGVRLNRGGGSLVHQRRGCGGQKSIGWHKLFRPKAQGRCSGERGKNRGGEKKNRVG